MKGKCTYYLRDNLNTCDLFHMMTELSLFAFLWFKTCSFFSPRRAQPLSGIPIVCAKNRASWYYPGARFYVDRLRVIFCVFVFNEEIAKMFKLCKLYSVMFKSPWVDSNPALPRPKQRLYHYTKLATRIQEHFWGGKLEGPVHLRARIWRGE